jgi:hypothetical protein
LKEWIVMLEDGINNRKCPTHNYYLKDWHFQQQYEKQLDVTKTIRHESDQVCCNREGLPFPLYTRPKIFEPDLLNAFFLRFTDGDYRFLYWGPARSFTGRHSDVLHSFSWSYNVVGVKEWVFFPPDDDDDDDDDDDKNKRGNFAIKVRQEAGQAMFVPATWQHEVINVEETISLNHNWISNSNLDLSWDCVLVEIQAIQAELLDGWWTCEMITSDRTGYMQTCENMLRGCVGLDVTGFFLMTLSQFLLTLQQVDTKFDNGDNDPAVHTQRQFDIFRLLAVLRMIMELDVKIGSIEERVHAVLQSDDLAHEVIAIARELVAYDHDDSRHG